VEPVLRTGISALGMQIRWSTKWRERQTERTERGCRGKTERRSESCAHPGVAGTTEMSAFVQLLICAFSSASVTNSTLK
jgi:hypothetical protein